MDPATSIVSDLLHHESFCCFVDDQVETYGFGRKGKDLSNGNVKRALRFGKKNCHEPVCTII